MFTLTTCKETKKRSLREQGQGLVEYALILSLVAVVVIIALTTVGEAVADVYEGIVCELNQGDGCSSCVNEIISVDGGCVGSTLLITLTSSCDGVELQVADWGIVPEDGAVNWPDAPVCTGTFSFIAVYSLHPDGGYSYDSFHDW